jgi:myo-inositol 2-dehydrogenase/D-chiro-inositol 1-dehydrogenase
MATDSDCRFGLIGFGLFGRHHANAIASADGAQLVAIAVKSEESQAAARSSYPDCMVYGDYRELLQNNDIDIVDVVVPNHLHFEISRAVIESGKHLFLEKPMANKLAHCDELARLAEQRGVIIAVNHELRLSALWSGVKQLIDDGAIGIPQYALVELSRFPYRPGSEGWRWDIDRVGNWILEEPIHFFDLARWYMTPCGEPISVYARANSRHADRPNLRDNFSAIVNFSNGGYAVVSQTLSAFEHHVTAKVAGATGTIWAYWSAPDARHDTPRFALRYGLGDDIQEIPFSKSTGELLELADHVAAVVRCVRAGAPLPCSGADGRWSTLLCLAAQASVDSGELVSIEAFEKQSSS